MKIKKPSKLKYGPTPKAKKIDTPSVKVAKKDLQKAEKKYKSAKAALKAAKKLKEKK